MVFKFIKKVKPKISTESVSISALFAALICVFSQLSMPTPFGIQLTLQTFAVALTAYTLGIVKGISAVSVYILCGAVGVPVFSGFGGGISVLTGPTGGFIFGFEFLVLFCGISCGLKHALCKISLSMVGLILCYLFGMYRLDVISGIGIREAFFTAVLPFLLKDLLSLFFALKLSERIKKNFKI